MSRLALVTHRGLPELAADDHLVRVRFTLRASRSVLARQDLGHG